MLLCLKMKNIGFSGSSSPKGKLRALPACLLLQVATNHPSIPVQLNGVELQNEPAHPFLNKNFCPKLPCGLPRPATHLSNIGHIQQFPKHVDTRGLQHLVDECGQRCPLGRLGQEQKLLLVLPCHLHLRTHGCTELGEPGLRLSGAVRKEDVKLEVPKHWQVRKPTGEELDRRGTKLLK